MGLKPNLINVMSNQWVFSRGITLSKHLRYLEEKKGGQLKMNLGYSLSLLGVMIINLLRIHTSMIKGYHKEDKLN